ncbi:MAG: alpha/beta hydrolase [Polyangiaceae bacterium]|nr:alpha/beta hydrolase [Polyangiaceae bacterium]
MLEGLKARLTGSEPDRNYLGTLRKGRAASQDGTEVAYEVLGRGEKAVVLANGLGGRLYAWEDLIVDLWSDYKIITWDYRGLFDSVCDTRKLAVAHHADDLESIFAAEGVKKAVLVGWSMGVQVSLQFAGNNLDKVAGLVLINGTYGHALSTGFQPLFSVPFLPKRLHSFIEFFRGHPELLDYVVRLARVASLPTAAVFGITAGPMVLRHEKLFRQYFDDVLGPSFPNYLRLFQELDAHSAYHMLPDIHAPALIVSGALDPLTPAYQSREMARRLPNVEHLKLLRAGHFALMERPDVVVPAVRAFLQNRAMY